jgi:hypothetical protein
VGGVIDGKTKDASGVAGGGGMGIGGVLVEGGAVFVGVVGWVDWFSYEVVQPQWHD